MKYLPVSLIVGRRNLPWLTSPIKRLIKKKHRLYRKAKKENKPEDWKNFRDQRTFVQKAMKKAHYTYLNNIFSEEGNKGMWRYIKNKKNSSSSVGTLHSNGRTGIDPTEKADMLNSVCVSLYCRRTDHSTRPWSLTVSSNAGDHNLSIRCLCPVEKAQSQESMRCRWYPCSLSPRMCGRVIPDAHYHHSKITGGKQGPKRLEEGYRESSIQKR